MNNVAFPVSFKKETKKKQLPLKQKKQKKKELKQYLAQIN